MQHSHTLTEHHQDFLSQNRTDPITGEKIEEGHTVVICAACKSAFFIESWEYLGYSHCDQTNTLKFLPLPQTLYLKANNKYTQEVLSFGFANNPMFMGSSEHEGCLVSIFFGFFSLPLGILIGGFFGGDIGFFTFMVGLAMSLGYGFIRSLSKSKVFKKYPVSIKEMENIEASLSLYIDYKLRALATKNLKTDRLGDFFDFENITEFKYHIIYHPNTNIDALYCQLQIRVTTTQRFSKDYFATIHRDTIPEWSDFISKLPTDLRIINTPFL